MSEGITVDRVTDSESVGGDGIVRDEESNGYSLRI